MNQFRPAEFEMTNSLINGFRRQIPKPMDCVINALQLMGALSSKCAELMRIVAGDGGFQKEQIEATFQFLFPSKQWKFEPFVNLEDLANYAQNVMKSGTVVFCGYQGYNPTVKQNIGHVFLVGKDAAGKPLYIDPQIPTICNLIDSACEKYIAGKNQYFILQYCCGNAIVGGGRAVRKRRHSPRKKSRRRSRRKRGRSLKKTRRRSRRR
jgi:hypothetical protein